MKLKVIVTVVILAALGLCLVASPQNFKEGDIVFQISKSKQSPLVQYATLSPWSHCGVIIEKGDKLYVLEASNVVKLTPLDEWKKKGRFGIIKRKRVCKEPVKIRYP